MENQLNAEKTFDEIIHSAQTTNAKGESFFSLGLLDDDELLALFDLAPDYSWLVEEYGNKTIADCILYSAGLYEEAEEAAETDEANEGAYFLVLEKAVDILRARQKR